MADEKWRGCDDARGHDTAIPPEQLLWAVGSLARLMQTAFDAELFSRSCPPPYRFSRVPQLLARLGLAGQAQALQDDLARLRLPCLVDLGPGEGAVIGLAVKLDGQGLWLFVPGRTDPVCIPAAAVTRHVRGVAITCHKPGAPPAIDPTEVPGFGFRSLAKATFKHGIVWRDILLASLVIQLIGLATPLFTQVVIDKVVVHQARSTLVVIGVGLLIFMVFNALLSWTRQYLILHTGNRIDAQLGAEVFEHLLCLPLRYFEHRPTGVVAARLHAVETLREFLASSLVGLLLDLPFLLIFVGVMFWYSAQLTVLVLALLACIAGLSVAVAPVFRNRLNQQFLLGARNQAFVTEYIAGLETVKSLQMEPQLGRRYRDYLSTYLSAGFETRQLGNTYNAVAGALEQLMSLMVLLVGAWIVMQGGASGSAGPLADSSTEDAPAFTIGMLVAFQMFAGRLSQPLMRLVGLWQQFQQASISMRRLADIMNAPGEPYQVQPSREVQRIGRVELKTVAFRYAQDRPLLYEDLSFVLQPGRTTVVVGPSGSGKSTLAKLLQGFLLPTAGQICIDGIDIQHLAANELRTYFGVVPQECVLFSGSILDNLALANPTASFEQMVQACKMAEIHAVIEALPKGYQTEIGERGAGLSGGQKQRLAIARALLKRPRILVFDEATSALDGETAEQFARTINALRGRVTMLFITHAQPKSLQVDAVIRLGSLASTRAAGPNGERQAA